MMPQNTWLTFKTGCLCAGSGCGGHLDLPAGPAQHTWTVTCDGCHPPGHCPPRMVQHCPGCRCATSTDPGAQDVDGPARDWRVIFPGTAG